MLRRDPKSSTRSLGRGVVGSSGVTARAAPLLIPFLRATPAPCASAGDLPEPWGAAEPPGTTGCCRLTVAHAVLVDGLHLAQQVVQSFSLAPAPWGPAVVLPPVCRDRASVTP